MSAGALNTPEAHFPEFLSWEELQQLPDGLAADIELWDRRVIWNRRGPLEHQQFSVRMRNALEASAREAMRTASGEGKQPCWQVGVETNVFFKPDKSSFLTPDFLVRHCLPRGADTFATDTALVGEVLSGSDTPKRVAWKMARYAEAGIPWYWEVELDSAGTWDISAVRAYELAAVPTAGLTVKPLRPAIYVPVGEWEPTGLGIDFPEPFNLHITWDDLAF
ncbi:Uma2 family endonuclease [Streptomyces sp. SID12501]|uniref:Uma2 family endonuclease n=1 Tax=Streptomyces sp. SID12501 TaxID=2706042 RepID=A0A6B3BNI0_9ACTN|nr:Uma2 family endonuclease [Streptomyces sp. SID12501]NEC85093.1 Uma2 family endonuclease [Streptomyces sp. SID12501]